MNKYATLLTCSKLSLLDCSWLWQDLANMWQRGPIFSTTNRTLTLV